MKRILLSLTLLLAGCSAGRSMYYLLDAEREFKDAVALEAETKAVYEYTLAHEYLLKAREEAGYSDYSEAEALARKSQEFSAKAQAVSEYGTSERELMLQEAGKDVPDEINVKDTERLVPLDDED